MIASTPADHLTTVLRAPFGWVHVNPTEERDHAAMRSRQLAGLLVLMSGTDGSDDMLHLAAKLSAEAAAAIHKILCDRVGGFDDIAVGTRQIAQILHFISRQLAEGPSDMLWLAEQLADELVDTVAGTLVAGGAA